MKFQSAVILFCLPLLAMPLFDARAEPASPPAEQPKMSLEFSFDYELARLASQAVATGDFSDATIAAIHAHPASAAMVRKQRLSSKDDLIKHLRGLASNPKAKAAAPIVVQKLNGSHADGCAPLADEVTRMLRQYVPPQFAARFKVYFIFGGNAAGFAFDDNHDDVYVNLAALSDTSTQELAEITAHELFHGVQAHLMTAPPRPKADTPASALGTIWTRRLLYDLLQEGSAELFTHPLVDRPAASAMSTRSKARIERNTKRIRGIVTMVETIGLRLLAHPPRDEDGYESIYGLLFYGTFDEPAYDLGWIMVNAIERHHGKTAVLGLLKDDPKLFLLRYQELTQHDAKLPKFSEDFVRAVRAL